jgi:hypothetical protein
MKGISRVIGLSFLLGLAIVAGGLQSGALSVSAQTTTTAAVSCNAATCTVTLSGFVAPGSSFAVTLPSGAQAVINCPSGCAAGNQYTVSANGSQTQAAVVTVPQTTTVITQTTATAPPGGLCVNGSVPGPNGCTSPFVAVPVAVPYAVPSYTSTWNNCWNWCNNWNWNNVWPWNWNRSWNWNNNNCSTPGCNPCTWTPVAWRHC